MLLPSGSPFTEFSPHFSFPSPLKGHPLPLGIPTSTLEHQISTGLGISSPTEAKQGSPLLHMYLGPQTNLYLLFGLWLRATFFSVSHVDGGFPQDHRSPLKDALWLKWIFPFSKGRKEGNGTGAWLAPPCYGPVHPLPTPVPLVSIHDDHFRTSILT